MITRGSRFYFALAFLAYLGAIVWGLSTGGHLYGVFSLGYKEGVGDHVGYSILIGTAVVSAMLGFVTEAFRDADPDAQAEVVELESVPEVEAPRSLSPWPVVAAFSAGTLAIGLVVSSALFVVGLVGLGIVTVEWAVTNWADRQTGDPAVNRAIRNRILYPIEIPVGALLGIGVIVLAVSRVLLAIPKDASVVLAIVVATLVLIVASIIAAKPRVSANVVSALLLIGGVAVIASGIVAASVGTRDIEEHHEEHEYEEPPVGGELPPERPEVTTTTAGDTSPTTDTTESTEPAEADAGSGSSGQGDEETPATTETTETTESSS